MAGMGDGYVGTAQDAVRIRRLEKQREVERKKIQELKNKSAGGQTGLLQFGSSTSEILETAFKKETVGLVTREQYVEKRVNIRNKIEEEEKEKLQKLQQEEEELEMQKRKKRRIRGNTRLSFSDEVDNGSDEEDAVNDNQGEQKFKHGKVGKDPTVETCFLPDSEREAEEQAERERLRKQWYREQELIRNEPLQITYSYWDGAGHRRVIQVCKGDSIGEFLRAVQQQLAPEFREIRTTSVENLLYVKEDLIIPHQHSFYELIVNKARGKSGPLFHFDVHEDVRTIADATKEKDESHAGKVVERHWYEKNKHIFPASRWEIYDQTKKWERYTIHGD
uniref:Protein XAP5 CIRCADIAN TIMEKEEPER n=1 Tax=Anthurium amnicola TaxID=1678845 RepID=A0A1D1YPA8_9ARAE